MSESSFILRPRHEESIRELKCNLEKTITH